MKRSSERLKRTIPLLGMAAAMAVAAGSATASTPTVQLVTPALASDAGAGRLLWTRCPAGNCGLYTRFDGVTSRLPIAAFGLEDDAQEAALGIGPGGQQVAAYDRCGPSLRNCGLYIYDFSTGTEERLPVSEHHGAFMTPTVSGDRVAYAYNRLGRDGPNRTFEIYWSYLDGTRMYPVHTEPLDAARDQPVLALNGDHLAYAGDSRLTSCLDQTHVRIITLGTRHDQIVATGSGSTDVFFPRWDGASLYYGRDVFTAKNYRHDLTPGGIVRSRVERYSLATGATTATPYARVAITRPLPNDGAVFYQLITRSASTTGLYAADPPRFHAIRAHRRLSRVGR